MPPPPAPLSSNWGQRLADMPLFWATVFGLFAVFGVGILQHKYARRFDQIERKYEVRQRVLNQWAATGQLQSSADPGEDSPPAAPSTYAPADPDPAGIEAASGGRNTAWWLMLALGTATAVCGLLTVRQLLSESRAAASAGKDTPAA